MSLATFIILVCFASFPCLVSTRAGLIITVIAGFAQDPVRKMLPEEPVYATLLAGYFLGLTLLGRMIRREPVGLGPIFRFNPVLRAPVLLFFTLVLIQSGVTLVKTGSPLLSGLGLLTYGAPLPAFLLGYHATDTFDDVRRLLLVHVAGAVVMMTAVYLSVLGVEHELLRSVGPGLHAFSPFTASGILELHQGLFRGSELAGWHGAAAACFLLILYFVGRRGRPITTTVTFVFLLTAVVFTGRRKFLVETVLFLAIFALGLWWWRRGGRRLYRLAFVAVLLFVVAWGYVLSTGLSETLNPYYQRSVLVSGEAPDRLSGLTVDAFRFIVIRNGFFGSGAGVGSSGSQYFGGGSSTIGSAAEGGVGKVLAELGVPGVLLLLWLTIAYVRYGQSVVWNAYYREPQRVRLAVGVLAFLGANATVFLIAHQIFGDLFVLTILGWLAGVLCAVPRVRLGAGTRWVSEAPAASTEVEVPVPG